MPDPEISINSMRMSFAMNKDEEFTMKSFRSLLIVSILMLMGVGVAWAGLHDAPYSYAFDGWSAVIDDWTNSGTTNYTTGHDAPNSVKFDNTGDYIISPTIDNCDTMKVWLKGNSTTTPGIFKIYAQVGAGGWVLIRECTWGTGNDIPNGSYALVVIPLAAPFRAVDDVSFEFVYELKNVGNVAMDDFSVTAAGTVDTTPPSIVAVTALNATSLDVLFSEALQQASAQTVTNYSVDHSVGNPLTATLDGTNHALVHLTFNTLAANNYVLTANGVQDLAGNPCVNATGSFAYGMAVNVGDVVINEIMYDDTASTDAEWVELHNRTASAIDISGWVLIDAGQYPPTSEGGLLVPTGTTIAAHGYLVVSRDVLPGITGYVQCTQYYGTWALGNSGDNLALYTAQTGGTLIDGSLTQFYPDDAASNAGNSIEKCDEDTPWPSDSLAWHVSTNVFATTGRYRHCTPGATNSICQTDVTPPTLVSAAAIGLTQVTVTFSEDVDPTTSQVAANYSVNLGVGNPISAVRQTNPAIVILTFGTAMAPNSYTLTVNNVQDVAGNAILPNSQIPFTVLAPPANFIFTEIMPNPNFPGLEDSLGEWFEIYNAGVSAVDLSGWVISDNAGADTIEGPATINAGQYFVFCSNGDPFSNGGVPVNYAYHFGTSGWGLSLNNTNDSLTIKNGAGAVAAQLVYNLNFGWSEGRSGQLRDLSYNPAIDTSWCRADTIWAGAYNGDHGTPQHATICAANLPPSSYSICDIRVQDAFGISVHDQQRVITQGVVTYTDTCRRNAYIENNGCAVMIYGNAVRYNMQNLARPMQVGDLVEVNGYNHNYRGLTEIDSMLGVVPTVTFLSGNHSSPAPVTVTAAQMSKAVNDCSPEAYEARHVRIENLTFQYGGDSLFSGGTSGVNYLAWSGTDTVVFRVVPCDTLVGHLIPAGTVTLNCIVSQFDASSPYCGGYQMVTGNYAPFGAGQCSTPLATTCYRDGTNDRVILRWQPGVNQQCDCYEIWYATDATAQFPAGYTLLDHVTGTTQYIDNSALSNRRFYVVRAGGPSCP
jgi:hypothetical protein